MSAVTERRTWRALKRHYDGVKPLRPRKLFAADPDRGELRVAEVWRRGSVIGSWLLDLIARGRVHSPTLEEFSGRVSDSGEGRCTSAAAIDVGLPAPVLTPALYSRSGSSGLDDFASRLLPAQRKVFGGHGGTPFA
jgi:6-phosphogluconate dehydrogenase (decarboxylating)